MLGVVGKGRTPSPGKKRVLIQCIGCKELGDCYIDLGHYNEITCFSSAPHRIAGGFPHYFYTSINPRNLVYSYNLAHDYPVYWQVKVPHLMLKNANMEMNTARVVIPLQ